MSGDKLSLRFGVENNCLDLFDGETLLSEQNELYRGLQIVAKDVRVIACAAGSDRVIFRSSVGGDPDVPIFVQVEEVNEVIRLIDCVCRMAGKLFEPVYMDG